MALFILASFLFNDLENLTESKLTCSLVAFSSLSDKALIKDSILASMLSEFSAI